MKTTRIVNITPDMALDWLEKNRPTGSGIVGNRRIVQTKVIEFTEYMKQGRWFFNGASISFDRNHMLIDGQHRLMACVAAGVPFESVVVEGCEEDSITSIDTGTTRRPADILSMYGWVNTTNLSAALHLLYCYKSGPMHKISSATSQLRKIDLVPFAAKHAKMSRSVSLVSDVRIKKLVTRSVAAFLHYVFSEKDEEMADTFFDLLKSGASLHEFHPVLVLRNKLLVLREGRRKPDKLLLIAIIIKAWNAFAEGRNIRMLRQSVDEPFPPIANPAMR